MLRPKDLFPLAEPPRDDSSKEECSDKEEILALQWSKLQLICKPLWHLLVPLFPLPLATLGLHICTLDSCLRTLLSSFSDVLRKRSYSPAVMRKHYWQHMASLAKSAGYVHMLSLTSTLIRCPIHVPKTGKLITHHSTFQELSDFFRMSEVLEATKKEK